MIWLRDEKRKGVQGVIGFGVSARISLGLREVVAVLQERLKMFARNALIPAERYLEGCCEPESRRYIQ